MNERPSAENDETCPRCGNHRPHGCLCHIPVPKRYTREDMARAWNEGLAVGMDDDRCTNEENPYVNPPGEGKA